MERERVLRDYNILRDREMDRRTWRETLTERGWAMHFVKNVKNTVW